jgi:GNAT superfamily N-acetyltransferase
MIRIATLNLYERCLDGPVPPASAPLPPGLEVEVHEPMAAGGAAAAWHPEARARLAAGEACALVRAHGAVVAYCWSTTAPAPVEEIRRHVVPAGDEVYLYDAYTAPEWRGKRLFPAMLTLLLAAARARGRRRALIFALAANRASTRAIEHAGFQHFLAISRVSIGGTGWLWVRGPRSARARMPRLRRGGGRT